MKQQPTVHHYILTYDADNQLWYHDVETEREKFPDGATMNLDTGETYWGYLGDGEYAPNESELNEQIVRAVRQLNQNNREVPFTVEDFEDYKIAELDDETDRTHIPYPPF
jgi:RecJ-like exonuclease